MLLCVIMLLFNSLHGLILGGIEHREHGLWDWVRWDWLLKYADVCNEATLSLPVEECNICNLPAPSTPVNYSGLHTPSMVYMRTLAITSVEPDWLNPIFNWTMVLQDGSTVGTRPLLTVFSCGVPRWATNPEPPGYKACMLAIQPKGLSPSQRNQSTVRAPSAATHGNMKCFNGWKPNYF